MKFFSIPLVLLIVSTIGSWAETLPEIDKQPHFQPSELKQLPWFEKSTLESYRKIGSRNPKWDKDAELGLAIYARYLTGQQAVYGTTNYTRMVNCFSNAVAKGCDDPLVNYAAVRLRAEGFVLHKQAELDVYENILLGLKKHSYPAIRHCRIYQRTVQLMQKHGNRDETTKAKMIERLRVVADRLPDAINERGEPSEIYEVAAGSLQLFKEITGDRKPLFDQMQTNFAKVTVKSTIPLGIAAQFYGRWAWDARGNGFVDSVTDEGWDLFHERLNKARRLADEAWKISQDDAYICKQMVDVAGASGSDQELELWFSRGKKADPSYYDLYICRIHYLQPKWGGSHKQMVDFGRECVKEGNWVELIPFVLVGVHHRIGLASQLKQPALWKELESVYQTYLAKYPANNVQRSAYCYYAARAGQWDTAKKLLDQLGDFVVPHAFEGDFEFHKLEIEANSQPKK